MHSTNLATITPLKPAAITIGPDPHPVDPEILSEVVAAIYDAALEPETWPSVLDLCRRFVGGVSAALYAKDLSGLAGGIFYSDGRIGDNWARLYFEKYARLDPMTGGHLLAPLEVPVSNDDLIDIEELHQTRFYREWSEPQGLVDFVSASIEKKGNWAAMFGVFRHADDGPVDMATKARTSLIVPHIRRSVLIGKVIDSSSKKIVSLSEAADGLASGMFLVDAGGRVVHSNAAGQKLLADGVLSMLGGRLVAASHESTLELAEVLAAAGEGKARIAQGGTSIALTGEDGQDHVAHVLPLTAGARHHSGASTATAAVFVRRATLELPAAPEVMARTFGLTISELRVLNAIVQAGGVAETAEVLGIAETTVKTHLHRVFAKTGTSRQADLVRLVAGFASPLMR